MANYTTGAERYNKRMDKIMERWRENAKKYNWYDENGNLRKDNKTKITKEA